MSSRSPSRSDVEAVGSGSLVQVTVEGSARPWFVLREDLEAVEAAREAPPLEPDVNLLAPLDPLVYDRVRTRALFDFDYVWEVYTPVGKRRWGYYALPILYGDRLVGRIDPRLERRTSTLRLEHLSFETDVDVEALAGPLSARLREYASFLGAERIRVGRSRPALSPAVRRRLAAR